MYPDSFKEELGNGLCCDALLAGTIIDILEKRSTTTKTQSFPCLVDGSPDMLSIEIDSHGLSGVGRGVYKLCLLVVDLAILLGMCYILCMCVCGCARFDNCV